jgi:hypothetical protein
MPTRQEIEAAQAHAAHDAALEAPLHQHLDELQDVPFHGGVLHTPGEAMTNAEQLSERGGHL